MTDALTQPAASATLPNTDADEAARSVGGTVLLLMGVCGCGKTTIALELQGLLGWQFQEGDDLHPPANVEKMRAGHPLTDEDRWPWLARVAQWVDDRLAAHEPGIITCSDLKRAYRKITIGDREGALLVYLRADEPLIAAQLAQRKHRYMPESLLHSQFETLEEPTPDEHPIVVPIAGSVRDTAIDLLRKIAAVQARERRPDRVSPVTCESTARSA